MLLITRPNYDYATRYISTWAQKVIDLAKTKGIKVFDLEKNRVTKKNFESMIKKHNPLIVYINGHGNPSCVTGQDGKILVEEGVNEEILKDTITYALSCSSSKRLGPASVIKGAKAYIGYQEDFVLMYDNKKRTRPEIDKTAELFLEPSTKVVISLIKKHSVRESVINAKQDYIRNVQKLLTSQSSSDDKSAVRFLLWDMQNLVYSGDANTKI